VTDGIRSGIGLTRLTELDRTDSIELRQDGCLHKDMKALQERTDANLREVKAEIRTNNEKFEVLQGDLVSWMDIHEARTEAMQQKPKANLKEEIKAGK
jgi:predicted glycoside hydrolase/deacetylase ChbG (UPF0249 family)